MCLVQRRSQEHSLHNHSTVDLDRFMDMVLYERAESCAAAACRLAACCLSGPMQLLLLHP